MQRSTTALFRRVVPTASVTLLVMLGLAGCGGSDAPAVQSSPAATSSAAQHNDADTMFAQMMIPHHEQALEMAKLARTRAGRAEVKALAARIEAAQDPEITMMRGWLSAWGAAAASPGMQHGMPGEMSEADMAELEKASGAEFDRLFLSMMIDHHTGAVQMATEELTDGQNVDAKTLAGRIKTAQTSEIAEMRSLQAS